MYNSVLEKQANNAKNEIKSLIEDLIIEIHELEEANEELKAKINELENKLDNSL